MGKPEGKRLNGNTAVDGRIILRWIFRMGDPGHGLDRSGSVWDRWRGIFIVLMNIRVL